MDAVLGHMFTSVQYGYPTEPLFPVAHIWPKDEAVAPARTCVIRRGTAPSCRRRCRPIRPFDSTRSFRRCFPVRTRRLADSMEPFRSCQTRTCSCGEEWLKFLVAGVAVVAVESTATARHIVALREEIREDLLTHLGRAAANALRLHERLFPTPIMGVQHVSEFLDIGFAAANRLVDRMAERGVLVEITGNARNRRFAYQRYIALFDD